MNCGHLKSTHVTGSQRRILSRLHSKTGSSRLQTPAPSLAPAAQTPLPRPQPLLGRGCTASVALLVSDFCSRGKPASFFANLYNATFLPLWLSAPASPTRPRNTAWEAENTADAVGTGCFPAWTTFTLEAKCTHRAPQGDPEGLTRSCLMMQAGSPHP